jgi:hypothetical protein
MIVDDVEVRSIAILKAEKVGRVLHRQETQSQSNGRMRTENNTSGDLSSHLKMTKRTNTQRRGHTQHTRQGK